MIVVDIVEILGTMAFAVSGTLAAIEKRLDIFGIFTISFVTSIGGGTIRDLLIGATPVAWLQNLDTFYVIFISTVLAIVFRKYLEVLRSSLFLFDTIGIGLFTLIGIHKGIDFGLHPIICILLGTISACFGGVVRDILCNEIPVIFRKEIYATACLMGGVVFFILYYCNVNDDVASISTATFIILIRLLAVIKKWSLPQISLFKNEK